MEGVEKWEELFSRIKVTIKEWREENPRATLSEIEAKVDEELSQGRAQMIEDMALVSKMADISGRWAGKRPKCPQCGGEVVANGRQKRKLKTDYEREIELERSKGYCPQCEVSFFPPG